MQFSVDHTLEIIERTPSVMRTLLSQLDEEWTHNNEGGETWSPYDVIGHLIHGEKRDWLERMDIILNIGESRPFTPFDRFAQFTESNGKTLNDLLDEFETLRAQNVQVLRDKLLTEEQLTKTGMHPALGRVTLKNLIATWAVHDLDHIAQIVRAMSYQYASHVGPWEQYLGILQWRK